MPPSGVMMENNIKTYLETGEVKMFDKKITL